MRQAFSDLPAYRAYHLSCDGRIASAEVIPATNDQDAMAFAGKLKADHQIELWERGRRLAVYEPHDAAAEDGR